MRRLVAFALFISAVGMPTFGRAEVWEIDPAHTSAQFAVRHMMISTVRGDFGKVSGVVNIDEQDLTKSSVEATIDTASINTRTAKRDEHLRSPDFLDVTKYPAITFKSKKVEKVGDTNFKVTGDLTIRGMTKEVVLEVEGSPAPFKDPLGNVRMGGQATTKINRKDFGIVYNTPLQTGGLLIGEEVSITVDVELMQNAASAATAASGAGGAQ
jgi:polyisoprenoid-binding protein YceI